MIRGIVIGLIVLGLGAVAFAGVGLVLAHRQIDAMRAPLPEPEQALHVEPDADLPVRLTWVNTARQAMPRGGVLDAALDPEPDAAYVMSHPSFVLEWADGRIFLIDLGMDAEGAAAFGAPMESFGGAAPIAFERTLARALGDDVSRVAGIGFTHLHTDHVSGLVALCDVLPATVPVMQTAQQADEVNYTTRGQRALIEAASCAASQRLSGEGRHDVPGFPGLSILAAGGHTPGSQIFLAHVRDTGGLRRYAIVGDIVNHGDALAYDLPKPAAYSRFVVPEAVERTAELRRYLRALIADHGVIPLVPHDLAQLSASGAPPR